MGNERVILILVALLLLLTIIPIGLMFLFATETGVNFVHNKTNIICNHYYDEDSGGWLFGANSTEISDFINECKSRGIGNSIKLNDVVWDCPSLEEMGEYIFNGDGFLISPSGKRINCEEDKTED